MCSDHACLPDLVGLPSRWTLRGVSGWNKHLCFQLEHLYQNSCRADLWQHGHCLSGLRPKVPSLKGHPAFYSASFCPLLQIASLHRLPFGHARSPTLVAMPGFPESWSSPAPSSVPWTQQYSSTTNSAQGPRVGSWWILDSRSAEWFISSVRFVEQGCSSWYSVTLSGECFYFQGNACVGWHGGMYVLSKKTNLLLEDGVLPLRSEGGPEPSAREPVESAAGEAIWKPSLFSFKRETKTDLSQGPRGFRQSQLPQKIFVWYRYQECFWPPPTPTPAQKKRGVGGFVLFCLFCFFYICAFISFPWSSGVKAVPTWFSLTFYLFPLKFLSEFAVSYLLGHFFSYTLLWDPRN